MKTRIEKIVEAVSNVAGRQVELTVRGLREFTFSFEGIDLQAEKRIIGYFGNLAECNVSRIDDETDKFTSVFVNVK